MKRLRGHFDGQNIVLDDPVPPELKPTTPVPLTHEEATAEINRFNVLADVVPMTWSILERALQTVAAHGMALWDAQIFAAAVLHGATTVLSEDFQHRRSIDGITFLNPF